MYMYVYIQTDPAENYTQENGWASGESEENIFNLHTIYLFSLFFNIHATSTETSTIYTKEGTNKH